LRLIERSIGIEIANDAPNRRNKAEWVAGCADFDIHILNYLLVLIATPDHWHRVLITGSVFAVPGDSDDGGNVLASPTV
jgi:hypothetical protein